MTAREVIEGADDLARFAMTSRVLRPLSWLGLMESRRQKRETGWGFNNDYRAAPLLGQLLAFAVEMQGAEAAARH